MADTRETPGDDPETAATSAESATGAAPEEPASPENAAPDNRAEGDPTKDDAAEHDAAEDTPTEHDPTEDSTAQDGAQEDDPTAGDRPDSADDSSDDDPAGPYPTRVGWVVAAFLLFWPLAIPALVLSMRTAEANGTGNARRAKKSSVRTLDFALGAVVLGALGIVALAVGVAAAPTYASSLPPGLVSAARSFVPPALAGPLGITQPDDGAGLADPTSSPAPSDDPYATADPYDQDSYDDGLYDEDPYMDAPAERPDPLPTPEAGGRVDPSAEPSAEPDTTATAGAEIPDLEVGDCFDTAATSGQSTLYRIPVVPCTTAHGGEIYAETTAPDSLAKNDAAPTQQALWDAADAYCYPQFTEFVGMRWARSELLYWPIAPSEQSWAEGDRRILCVVESEEPVTGSLEGAER